MQWAYLSSEDIQIAEKEQVLHCKVEGEWNLNDPRNIKYVLRNSDQIVAVFNEQQKNSSGYKGYVYVSKANVLNIQVFYDNFLFENQKLSVFL